MEKLRIGDIDPSMPTFRYPEHERADLRARGFTDEQLDQKEKEIRNRLAQNQLQKEAKARDKAA